MYAWLFLNAKFILKAADGLHGDAAQERDGGEEALEVRDAPHLGGPRRRHPLRQLPRGGTVRHGHLHQGAQQAQTSSYSLPLKVNMIHYWAWFEPMGPKFGVLTFLLCLVESKRERH